MELSRLRELLSLEKRGLIGETGPGVPQPPNKLASSSSSVSSRALSFTSPGSRGQGGALFNGICSRPESWKPVQAEMSSGSTAAVPKQRCREVSMAIPIPLFSRGHQLCLSWVSPFPSTLPQPGQPEGCCGVSSPQGNREDHTQCPFSPRTSQPCGALYPCLVSKCRTKVAPRATCKQREGFVCLFLSPEKENGKETLQPTQNSFPRTDAKSLQSASAKQHPNSLVTKKKAFPWASPVPSLTGEKASK